VDKEDYSTLLYIEEFLFFDSINRLFYPLTKTDFKYRTPGYKTYVQRLKEVNQITDLSDKLNLG